MNGMILQTPTENKDIKHISKKDVDTKSEKDGNLFENLIAKLVSKEEEGENTSFLLAKLLNLQSDFANKGKTISEFSKGDILSDEKGEEIALEDLFKIALMLKNDAPADNINKIAKELHISLDDKKVIAAFKDAKNIQELLKVADKHGIKVKNFEFLNPAAALSPKDKKIVQKITSEEIFKMIEPKALTKELNTVQSVLTKIITKDIIQKEKVTTTPTTLTSLLKKEDVKNIKTEKVLLAKSETPKSFKTELKSATPTVTSESELETFQTAKPKKSEQNTLATLLKNETAPKALKDVPLQTKILKEETLVKTESSKETQTETPIEKNAPTHEVKTEVIHKTKDTPDVKKTFNTFAMEFKEKVEAYKPPMMKINMQLSPGSLGDVDVTLVSRGNNLQVNINSNANTLALFVQNQAEFKNSLVNMGFSDLQMNFGDNRGEQRGQNKQKEQEEQGDYHDSLENEELEGINMLIPHYV